MTGQGGAQPHDEWAHDEWAHDEWAGDEGAGDRLFPDERAALVARWLHLTRRVLPAMAAGAVAAGERWPVHLDHCFMRICLDEAVGAPWHAAVRRPAVRHATAEQLRRAVAVAELVVADPRVLPALNRSSLEGRRRAALPP